MLDRTVALDAPGANIRGDVTGGNWIYVLPGLAPERALVLGTPTVATLRGLAGRSGEVLVTGMGASGESRLRALARGAGLANVRTAVVASTLPLPDRSVGAVLVADRSWVRRFLGEPELRAEVDRILLPAGRVFLQPSPGPGRLRDEDLLWLQTVAGEVRAAAPSADRDVVAWLSTTAAPAPEASPWRRRAVRTLRAVGLDRRKPTRAVGALLGPGAEAVAGRPPRYLVDAAAAAGLSLDGYRWALSAPGRYPSKKVLLFLFPPGAPSPRYIVKLTRDPRFNARLENEWRALTLLSGREPAGGAVPEPVFVGQEGGLLFVCETVLDGERFRRRTTARPDCSLAPAFVDWLVDLGIETADGDGAPAREVAATLAPLLQRFITTYAPRPDHQAFLADQLALLGDHPGTVPLVFQHGDAGMWNLLVDARGRLGVLDWEAADPRGAPLWDLFYFLRSYGVWIGKVSNARGGALEAFERHYLHDSELGRLLGAAVARFCTGAQLDRRLVEPLFYLCWMHRAVKEASRLPSSRVRRGHYANLLYRCMDQRHAPGLRRLFDGEVDH